jgi:hypothetical protein
VEFSPAFLGGGFLEQADVLAVAAAMAKYIEAVKLSGDFIKEGTTVVQQDDCATCGHRRREHLATRPDGPFQQCEHTTCPCTEYQRPVSRAVAPPTPGTLTQADVEEHRADRQKRKNVRKKAAKKAAVTRAGNKQSDPTTKRAAPRAVQWRLDTRRPRKKKGTK